MGFCWQSVDTAFSEQRCGVLSRQHRAGCHDRPEFEPTVADDVEHGRHLGRPDRIVIAVGKQWNAMADADGRRLSSHRAEPDLRCGGRIRHGGGLRIKGPDAVKADLFGDAHAHQ